jgi:hypothetical protein
VTVLVADAVLAPIAVAFDVAAAVPAVPPTAPAPDEPGVPALPPLPPVAVAVAVAVPDAGDVGEAIAVAARACLLGISRLIRRRTEAVAISQHRERKNFV